MQFPQRRAVITGIGLVSGSGFDLDTFWNNLMAGRSSASLVERIDTTGLPSKVACTVHGFAPSEFLSSGSANGYALAAQYAVAAARLATEDSGSTAASIAPLRPAVIACAPVGQANPLAHSKEKLNGTRTAEHDPLALLNARSEGGAAAITLEMNLRAQAMTISSRCGNGTEALGQALNLIRNDDADWVLAGAADTPISPDFWGIFSASGLMSRESEHPGRAMKPFSRDRDGFILGEGAAFLVIEELSAARARGAKIYAEILEYAQSIDSPSAPAGPRTPFESLNIALRRAGVAPREVNYLNANGIATAEEDIEETAAIKRCFGEDANHLQISATKPVTGHWAGAAGSLEAAVCALAIERHAIPPTINLQKPDPSCDLDYVPNNGRAFPVDVALSLNAGFGKHTSCLVFRTVK